MVDNNRNELQIAKEQANDQLELVVDIFRHGARQAILQNTTGPLENHGKAQLYNLGQILRQRYVVENKLLNEQFNQKQIYLHSSPVQRAQESLKWMLVGLYPSDQKNDENEKIVLEGTKQELPPIKYNQTDQIIKDIMNQKEQIIQQNSQVDFNLINHGEKVKTEKKEDRFYHYYKHCTFTILCQTLIKNSDKYFKIVSKVKESYVKLVKFFNEQEFIKQQNYQFNEDKPQFQTLSRFLDYYACTSNKGEHVEIYTPQIQEQLRYLKCSVQDMIFQHDDIQKLSISEHLINFSKILTKKFKNKQQVPEKDLKMLLYSCHDRNLYLLMSALISQKSKSLLGYSYYVPPFASQLQFKIYSNKKFQQQKQNTKELYNDLNQLHIEMSLNDQRLLWKGFNKYRITLQQFIHELIPQVSFNEEEYEFICKQSQQFNQKHQNIKEKKHKDNNIMETIKVKAK
ncbi:hypothetical protein PPERSA_00726 [Pseudocohnilembus persalinus]|uniref:Histidine phosphatase superfamily, clade-2 n=1 Tax=Pseudocohnilembus persalinus TaxID=266149 RepID=A0A0V0R4P9_PSEPJ|nr:hypothetical protein PPERSA_00726 [Pseudocohnilembus persalinus]|eukprot:KRX09447.1 hypothetical protein PPERSA_00726 [Pseudocohnilembus persalinus]